MHKTLKIFLVTLIFLSTTLSFIILLAPKATQKFINTWFENGQENTLPTSTNTLQEIKILGPANSGSNLSQERSR
jgi:hypothetical protein